MLFLTANEDRAMAVSPKNFFAPALDDRSTQGKRVVVFLKFLLIATSIVAIPLFKDSLSHYLQHASAAALHIDETLAGILVALATKLPELSKLFVRPCAEESFSFNYMTCDEDQENGFN